LKFFYFRIKTLAPKPGRVYNRTIQRSDHWPKMWR
jgi:hypothetical protein